MLALARRTLLWSDSPHLETDLRLPSRSVLADLSRTSDSFSNMVAEAATAQVGNTDADLKRVKYAVTNLKGGVQELDAHARFLEGARLAGNGAAHMNARHSCGCVAPPRPSHAPGARRPARRVRAGEHGNGGGQRQGACLGAVPRGRCLCHDGGGTPPDSLPQWSEQVKAQKAELDVLRLQTEERIAALTAEVAAFEEGRAKALAQVDALPTANAAVPAQRGRRYTAAPLTPPDEGMEHLVRCLMARQISAASELSL